MDVFTIHSLIFLLHKSTAQFCIKLHNLSLSFFYPNEVKGLMLNKKKSSSTMNSFFIGCLGKTRTLTNGTRIRCATITPQGNFFCFVAGVVPF